LVVGASIVGVLVVCASIVGVLVVGLRCASVQCPLDRARPRAAPAATKGYQEAFDVPIGLMDIKGQIADVQDEVEAAVLSVVRSGQFILGPNVKAFEGEVTEYLATAGSVGVANGTDGLTIALKAAGIGEGDEVITTPFTFYATSEAIVQAGARPVFVDIDPETLNIDPAAIPGAITAMTKAVVPVDLFGLPADADAVSAVASEHGLTVIEDACQAFGASYKGRRAGSLGDLAVFSFFPTKNLGGYGDGGLVTGRIPEFVEMARLLRFHGSRDKKDFDYIGYNSRLDELQAAVLRVGLTKIDDWNARRAQVAAWYDACLPADMRRPVVPDGLTHVYHLYVARTARRDDIAAVLKSAGVACAAYYTTPLHLQPALSFLGYRPGDFPATEQAAATNLALPMHPHLTQDQVAEVARALVGARA
jgi:dTDP-4-amino-4,6-dideoxygalactose transaminase